MSKQKYDVGIFGVWHGCNYGSVATYYALNRLIEGMGKTVLMIDKPIILENDVERNETHARRFAVNHYNISPSYYLDEMGKLNDYCDAFVIGSDQLWNYGVSRPTGKAFYLSFADDDKKKISYAVSFGHGVDFAPSDERKEIAQLMSRFEGISVREADGVKLCKEEYGINAVQVLDPVFAVDPSVYDNVIADSKFNEDEPYLLTYILDPTPEKREAILHVAKELGGIKIINILDGLPWLFEKNKTAMNLPNCIENIEVQDWLYYIKNAKFVITDSCHGASFAIIFNKQFIAISNPRRGPSRFRSLSELFHFEDHLVNDAKQIVNDASLLKEIDYNVINNIMNSEQERCRNWLREVLDSPKKSDEELKKQNVIGIPNPVSKHAMKKHTHTITGRDSTIVDIMSLIECTGCAACSNICPVNAIEMKENSEGMLKPEINRRLCINCGICKKKCPAKNPQYNNEAKPKCYAMMADLETRKISSSGGMFSVAAEYILDNNGYVCGAAYDDDFKVRHIIINNKKDLPKLRGSKYMQSNPGEIYKEVKKLLENDELVMFTGMPCQVAGLYAYLGKDYEKLISIDLLCHGITSSKVFEKYHKEVLEGKPLTRLEFKEKQPWGWHAGVNAYFTDGTKYSNPLEKDLYFIAYLKSIAKNTSCEVCKANRLPRQADLTIGDFWGIAKADPEMFDNKGTSVVLVNNSKAQDFFDKIKDRMEKYKEESLKSAINGNHIIEKPYKLHKNRKQFFENFDKLSFEGLTLGCFNNKLYESMYMELFSNMTAEEQQYYYLAETVAKNANGRQIVTWIRSEKFEKILKEYFGLSVAFGITQRKEAIIKGKILDINSINGKSNFYYLVSLDRKYDKDVYDLLRKFGFKEFDDFIFKVGKPVVIENFDLGLGNYYDSYGNTIEGFSGIVKKIIFRGSNNHITFGKDIKGINNLEFDLTANSNVKIDDNCKILKDFKFESRGLNGTSSVIINQNCRLTNGLIKLYNHDKCSSILINEDCTFETNLELHANSGKKIIIGRDCMFSHDIDLWAGDGHTVFDVETGKNTNSNYDELPGYKNLIVIGDHVWVSKGAFIMHGTNIGSGSIVGAKSVVKGKYPNNCTIAGNPSKIVKKNVAWSREMTAIEPLNSIDSSFYKKSSDSNAPISGMNVLVIGGTRFMGVKLVKELIKLGNTVTIATRGNRKDSFGISVNRIKLDVSNYESCKTALEDKYYDVVFDNLAYCSEYANNILSNVNCGRYVQLSSVEAYRVLKVDMKESYFNPYKELCEIKSTNVGYVRGKRQAEAVAYQRFFDKNIITVRIPYVTPTERLYYYCDHIVNKKPMKIENIAKGFTFISDIDVGKFLVWISNQNFHGPINFASAGIITINMIIEYIESKVGIKAIIDTENGDDAPFNVYNENTYSMNLELAKSLGYDVPVLYDWIWALIDKYIEKALKLKK